MSTISNAVQEMVNNLTTKMQSGTPLSGEEQLLISKAISALQDNETWEKAVVAVVEEHLDTATGALDSAVTQFNTDSAAGINALSNAEASLLSKSAQLDIAAAVPAELAKLSEAKDGRIGNLDRLIMPVGGAQVYNDTESTTNAMKTNTIFCSDGEVICHVAPISWSSGSSGSVSDNHNFYRKVAGADKLTGTFSRYQYCFSSSSVARTGWNQRYSYGPAMMVLPLAHAVDGTVTFKELISDYSSTTQNAGNFRGVGLFYDTDYGVTTGHYHNADVKDKYGRVAAQLRSDYRSAQQNECVFYDNVKNCVVVIQDGKVWELYSNGWVDPAIATFGDDTQAQAWVDAQPDMFLVALQGYGNAVSYELLHSATGENAGLTEADVRTAFQSYANNLLSLSVAYTGDSNTAASYQTGVRVGSTEWGLQYTAGTGENIQWDCNQNFMWDKDTETLIPLHVHEVLEVIPPPMYDHESNTTNMYFWVTIKKTVKVTRIDTGEELGMALRLYQSQNGGNYQGIRTANFACINPYDGVWYEQVTSYNNTANRREFMRCIPYTEFLDYLKGLN
tara:strand:+ start:779 stop:2464 length:1686 start_codon:yes stop_codon:yes gene_type:complete